MADGDALHNTRTKAFSAVGIQKTLEKRLVFNLFSSNFSIHLKSHFCPEWLRPPHQAERLQA